MTIFFLILIVLASVILGLIILIQNPKGGGLSGNIAGVGNQFMGVKQTNDVLEKGTWIFSAVIALLCIFSTFFMTGSTSNDIDILIKINTNQTTTSAKPTTPATTPQRRTPPASNQP